MQRIAAILLLLLALTTLGACPRGGTTSGGAAGTAGAQGSAATQTPQPWRVQYPPEALNYLLASLQHPTEPGYPPLGPAWLVVAQLPDLEYGTPGAAAPELRKLIEEQVRQAKGNPPPELACAWLSCQHKAADRFIALQLNAGKPEYSIALRYTWLPAMLAAMEPKKFTAPVAQAVLNSIDRWGPDQTNLPTFHEMMKGLAEHSDETVRLRAIGCLLALGQASDEQRQYLKETLREGKPELLPAACEAVRFSRDKSFADALVPLVANTKLGDDGAASNTTAAQLFGSNALAFLGDSQAAMMRTRLLGAADPLVRWQARLGELLNGIPKPWYDALEAKGITDRNMWVTLQTPGAAGVALLHTYELAAANPDASLRLQAAQQLNRSPDYASNPLGVKLMLQLVSDKEAVVREACWYTCARQSRGRGAQWDTLAAQADSTVADKTQDPLVRLAAACCLLKWAELPLAEASAAIAADASGKGA